MTLNQQKIENDVIIASLKSETMGKLINRIPGSRLLISSIGLALRTHVNRSASLVMSTCVLKAWPGKLDIKRHSPSILYLSYFVISASCPGTKQVVKCRSNGNSYNECDLGPQGSSLISIKEENLIHHSDNLCTYFDRSYEDLNEEFAFEEEGFFGIVHGDDGNLKMWTTLGCFADFEYCLNCEYW